MGKLRRLSMVVVLTFALSVCAFAGQIGTSPEAPTPPPDNSLTVSIVLTLIQVVVP
jgi:hypothetical protein